MNPLEVMLSMPEFWFFLMGLAIGGFWGAAIHGILRDNVLSSIRTALSLIRTEKYDVARNELRWCFPENRRAARRMTHREEVYDAREAFHKYMC